MFMGEEMNLVEFVLGEIKSGRHLIKTRVNENLEVSDNGNPVEFLAMEE